MNIKKCKKLDIKNSSIDYDVVFSDIDGTLLDDNKKLSKRNLFAINNLKKNNIDFVLVSARGPMAIYPLFNQHNFNCPIVAYSGALILDENKNIIYSKCFDKEICQKIIDL